MHWSLCFCSPLLLELAVELMFSSLLSRLHRAMAERSGPYSKGEGKSSTSKGKGKDNFEGKGGKGSKWNPERVTPEQLVTYESIFKATSKGSKDTSKGKGSKASSSKGSKAPPDFSRMGGKGELLRRLWDLAEQEDVEAEHDDKWNPELEEPSKNCLARVRNIIQKRRARMGQAIELLDQVREMEGEYVRKWRVMNNTSECPPYQSLDECIHPEFWQLL